MQTCLLHMHLRILLTSRSPIKSSIASIFSCAGSSPDSSRTTRSRSCLEFAFYARVCVCVCVCVVRARMCMLCHCMAKLVQQCVTRQSINVWMMTWELRGDLHESQDIHHLVHFIKGATRFHLRYGRVNNNESVTGVADQP